MRIAGVVVDPPETNAGVVRALGLEFPVLSDPDLRLIDAFGLRHRGAGEDGRDIAHAASVLLDGAGTVRWTTVTTSVQHRPLPGTVLQAADALLPR